MADRNELFCQLAPANIDRLNRIFEGYDGLGIVSTLDRQKGLVVVRVTPDTMREACQILEHLPFPVQVLQGKPE